MSKDFTLSRQAIIQILLTKMKASGTYGNSEPFQKTSENFAELAKYQPNPSPKAFPLTSALSQAKMGTRR